MHWVNSQTAVPFVPSGRKLRRKPQQFVRNLRADKLMHRSIQADPRSGQYGDSQVRSHTMLDAWEAEIRRLKQTC